MRTARLLVVCSVAAFAASPPVAQAAACPDVAAPGRTSAWRAALPARTTVFDHPGRHRSRSLAPARVPALLILGRGRAAGDRCWLPVRLPWRPNDAAGWVAADEVLVEQTPWRIEVSPRRRTLAVYRAGTRVQTARVVVGKPSTPTPAGLFAVTAAIRWHARDFLGRWVITLTAHSDVLQRFDGGDGTVAIHGRGGASLRDPLGSARSHGCIRLANAAISRLVRVIGARWLPGTPVAIR